MNNKSNIGQTGADSIRIDGRPIQDLPLGQGNEAKDGLAGFLKSERENKIRNIVAKYPKQSAAYLKAAIRECEHNISKTKEFKTNIKSQISEYKSLIMDCQFRENELAKYSKDNPNDIEKIKELKLKYPPYDVLALQKQIDQFEEAINSSDEVIEKDYNSIAEIRQVLGLVEQRDKELLNIM